MTIMMIESNKKNTILIVLFSVWGEIPGSNRCMLGSQPSELTTSPISPNASKLYILRGGSVK